MKPEELMIGDWVYNIHHQRNIRVTAYDFFCHGHREDGSQFITSMCQRSLGRDLKPIPLNAKILGENGLLDDRHSEYWVSYDAHDEEWYFNCSMAFVDMRVAVSTVHELQHALRLCGIEKEIVL